MAKYFLPILIILFLTTIAVVSFYYARKYYLELNETRLFPLGNKLTADVSPNNLSGLVLVGDSRAAGWQLEERTVPYPTTNLGVSGFTTSQVKLSLIANKDSFQHAIVLIQAGINDLKTISLFPKQAKEIIEECVANIQEATALCYKKGAKQVIVSTIFPLGKLPLLRRPFWSNNINEAIIFVNKQLVENPKGAIIFDSFAILKDQSKEGAWGHNKYFRDFLHLNDEGYLELNKHLKIFIKNHSL